MRFGTVWSDERIEELTALWADGHSCSQIAITLGNGITRNSVIGKVTRLKLPIRADDQKWRIHHSRTPRAPRLVLPTAPRVILHQPDPIGETGEFVASGRCKFIHGDPSTPAWRMCGHLTATRVQPWCEFHETIVWQSKRQPAESEPAEEAA